MGPTTAPVASGDAAPSNAPDTTIGADAPTVTPQATKNDGLRHGLQNLLEGHQTDAQRLKLCIVESLPATIDNSLPPLLNRGADGGILCGRGNISQCAQQAQADRDVTFRVHANLVESRIQQVVEACPVDFHARAAGRIEVEMRRRF